MNDRTERVGVAAERAATAVGTVSAGQVILASLGFPVADIGAGLASPILDLLAKYLDPSGRRLQRVQATLEEAIQSIFEQVNRSPDELAADPAFRTAVSRAIALMARTERAARICLLREALVSVGTQRETSEDHIETFIRYIDELSPGHIRVLGVTRDAFRQHPGMITLDRMFRIVSADIADIDRPTFRQFFRDLEARGLIHARDVEDYPEYASKEELRATDQGGYQQPGITEFGERFIAFVSGRGARDVMQDRASPS